MPYICVYALHSVFFTLIIHFCQFLYKSAVVNFNMRNVYLSDRIQIFLFISSNSGQFGHHLIIVCVMQQWFCFHIYILFLQRSVSGLLTSTSPVMFLFAPRLFCVHVAYSVESYSHCLWVVATAIALQFNNVLVNLLMCLM